ncbi:DUF1329 domain-containing protein [Pseudomonas panipatensis]|uniref:Outer membrane lipoprotein-sorting protein n=1 Tax=Pseudomonas panipatensis TaxID=428992 RepID=A0A1G8IL20_9PSED|nr:DUF1329 domain-containing protein [Pseudomonas panipatensis]SDI19679.1 Protein of unknown function [Pseudomonas panipatensis]SMP73606.1 Protein of unknown function [Pseudomonas panipatensis]
MKHTRKWLGILSLSLLASSVLAAVSPDEAAKLGSSLTPLGGEKAGNADGSIPAWNGGLASGAAKVDAGGFLSDPYASDKPLFTITAQNLEQYRGKLSAGQQALFKRYPDYSMRIYPSHRSAAVPPAIAAAAKTSALKTSLLDSGNGMQNFGESRYYAFPIPKNGLEVIWNHLTRYRGGSIKRASIQATPQVDGSYTLVRMEDEVAFPERLADLDAQRAENTLLFYKSKITEPARLAGTVTLVHDTIDQVKEPREAWIYNAGQRRVRRAPQVAYDGPRTSADGLQTSDNFDMFSGAPDRYDWKLVGKQEMYIPYNNFHIASPQVKYADILRAGHINPELPRYELHRVWVVDATLKPGQRNIYAKRRFYLDEDSWQIAASDLYDGRGQLWRAGEAYLLQNYQAQVPFYAFEALYDLIAGRYIVVGMANEEKNWMQYGVPVKASDYGTAALRNDGVR